MTFDTREHTHRRFNALTGEWVLVSPHRAKRPWQGQQEAAEKNPGTAYDSACYLCPGNVRSGGQTNPQYSDPYVFTNDFSALTNKIPNGKIEDGLLLANSERGICKVICFSSNHSLTLPQMTIADITKVVAVWQEQTRELGALDFINHIQIFENKGSAMGCSNSHPHGQIWAQESIPDEAKRECGQQLTHFRKNARPLLLDYLQQELILEERIVTQNQHFATLVPYWATWPFETLIIPKRPMAHITAMTHTEVRGFAEMLQTLTIAYDNLFKTSFPYSAGIHQAPVNGHEYPEWTWHMHFFPPLLRSATVKKFMVGYEMLGEPQRDITPEFSAQLLREHIGKHYLSEI